MYCCLLIPSIREYLTAVCSVMTDCLPEKADCWECHSRHTAPGDASTQMEKHTRTHTTNSNEDAQLYPFICSFQIEKTVRGKNTWTEWDSSTQLFTGEQWSNWQEESMQRVDGQTLSPQADKHSQCSTDKKGFTQAAKHKQRPTGTLRQQR